MFTRREMLAASFSILGSTVLPKIVQSEEIPLDTEKKNDKILHSMTNGIDKIFTRVITHSTTLNHANITIKNKIRGQRENEIIADEFDEFSVRFPINLNGNVNDDAWHTLLAAASDATDEFEFPIIECSQFLKNKATDVFVDESAFRFFKHIYEEDELPLRYKIHSVNLSQYYDFYTKKLGKKINRYKGNLFVVANLSDNYMKPYVYSHHLNLDKYGCIVPKNEYFRIGQI